MPADRATEVRRDADRAWRDRAAAVIPGGMYGHMDAAALPASYPQFWARSAGTSIWDVDGNEYLDLMCSWGPMILGYGDAEVDAAFRAQLAAGDLAGGPSPRMVELAELFVATVDHADWAMFAKNGTDATTACLTVARAATGRRKVLKARRAYHGAIPWCTPSPAGVTPEDRANIVEFDYNDTAGLEAAAGLVGDDLAAVILTPHRHDMASEQVAVDPVFARAARTLCDRRGAALILDDVRGGFRTDPRGSWAPIGVRPDLTAFSKAIANGHPLAALTGVDGLRAAASSIFVTGSFWYGGAAMAASAVCVRRLVETDAAGTMARTGTQLATGLRDLAARHGREVSVSGPPAMPLLRFAGDDDLAVASAWTAGLLARGVFAHPAHNWFLSAAHSPVDVERVLEAADGAFAALGSALDTAVP